MSTFVLRALTSAWSMLVEAAPWMLLGLAMAGLVRAFLPQEVVGRHLGGRSPWSVIKATLIGIPLPLCSCGVVPAALGLRRQGAGKGATTAFLIATPETGVDSMALSYALLDPLMTVLRPLSALITATLAGLLVNTLDAATEGRKDSTGTAPTPLPGEDRAPTGPCDCCGSASTDASCDGHDHDQPASSGFFPRLMYAMRYGLGELSADIGPWFLLGTILAGIIDAAIPPGFLEQHLGGGLGPILLMLLIGLPLYVCATSSTPIAAALALKGLSPGAALVFLLSGPASNLATILVVGKTMGRTTAVVYVGSIALASIALGLAANWIYAFLGMNALTWAHGVAEEGHGPLAMAAALVLLAAIARPWLLGGKPACNHA